MSQRLRSCSKTTNFETINCEGYLNSLAKTNAMQRRPSRDRSSSKPSLVTQPPTPPNLRVRPGLVQQNFPPPKKSSPSRVHKVVDNSAVVEVTVRTKHKKVKTPELQEPWSKLLQSSSFNNFDPLRTLHFLGKELQTVLKSNTHDGMTSKIITGMLDALNRVPPEVALGLSSNNVPVLRFENKVCQTVLNCEMFDKTETVHKQLEESVLELDKKCKEMGNLCHTLKQEKSQLQRQLASEKDSVKYLRNHLDDLQTERVTYESSTTSHLAKEKDVLNTQIKMLQHQLELQTSSLSEARNQLDDVQKQKENIEQECIKLHHSLTISKLENEKYRAILSVRDRQIKEILTEMNQLQEVVTDELVEFQKNPPLLSQMSSDSTVLGTWTQVQSEAKSNFRRNEMGDNANVLYNHDTSFIDLPSLDSSTSNGEELQRKLGVPTSLRSVFPL